MRTFIITLLIFSNQLVNACSCDWLGNFFKATEDSELVVKVKVVEKLLGPNGFNEKMKVEIIETFKGTEERTSITILGDDGAECRPYIDYFDVGDVCYLALFNYQEEYELLICGEFYLKLVNGQVIGDPDIRKELSTISGLTEQEFLTQLRQTK